MSPSRPLLIEAQFASPLVFGYRWKAIEHTSTMTVGGAASALISVIAA